MVAPVSVIRKENAYQADSYIYYPVVIIGAGESGIALGSQLREQLGFDQFRIFERQAGIGGTWWINRYPGIACDIPAIAYSFSFNQNKKWTTVHPPGPEIVQYLEQTCEKYQIVDKIQLNTDVTSVEWVEEDEQWEIIITHLAHGLGDLSARERRKIIEEQGEHVVILRTEKVRAKIVASCVGGFVEPKAFPTDIPGRDSFEGEIIHTARWRPDVDLTGKDVVVIGTGCSAAQVIPQLIKPPYNVKSITQLMRSPPWVAPNILTPEGVKKWEEWMPYLFERIPGLNTVVRKLMFSVIEFDFFQVFTNTQFAERRRKVVEDTFMRYMKKTVPEKYHEILTPDYIVGCKRRIIDDGWFKSLREPNVDLTTRPLTSIQSRGVTLGPGRYYPSQDKSDSKAPNDEVKVPADVIILANGFDTDVWRHPVPVRGRGGKSIKELFDERGGPQAYQGTALDGFPNFFFIFGPNTATGHSSVILASENQVNYSLKFMRPVLDEDVRTYEVKESAERAYTFALQEKIKHTLWNAGGCTSWYKYENGWNAAAYPWSQIHFTLACMFPKWTDWNVTYTRKGLLKLRLRKLLTAVTLLGVLASVLWARRRAQGVKGLLDAAKFSVAAGLQAIRNRA